MWITVNGQRSTEIEDNSLLDILNLYPEEGLCLRPIFKAAFDSNSIEFKNLKSESEKCLIPWQLFFLSKKNLDQELKHVEEQRAGKVSSKLLSKRTGQGELISNRILDRLIRLQNYICSKVKIAKNTFCGSLIGKTEEEAVAQIITHFNIDLGKFRSYSTKSDALKYLIKQIELKYINICQGVLSNGMLPHWRVVKNILYKSTSGFIIKNEHIPFLFLPSEINPSETDGRQIYTLIYLLVLIGLDEYSFVLERNFTTKVLKARGITAKIHRITSKLLLPTSITEPLKNTDVTLQIIDRLADRYKITPTAVIVTLRIRKIISFEEYNSLLPEPYVAGSNSTDDHRRNPHIDTSIKKFCGKHAVEAINKEISNGTLFPIQAQYLFFGTVNKKGYKSYLERMAL